MKLLLLAATLAFGALSASASGPAPLELRRAPYLGVACPAPNSIECDRVGLAVWLRKPAVRLRATIAGMPVTMRVPPSFRPSSYLGRRGEYWEGFLQPAGLIDGRLRVRPDRGRYIWFGGTPRRTTVRLTASRSDGSTASTTVRLRLHAGWG